MRRREFVFAIAAVICRPLAAHGQNGKVYRIGFLGNSTAALESNLVGPFRDGLRQLGYEEGRNAVIEYRWAEGRYERFPELVRELLDAKVDVIVTAGTPATLAVQKASTSVPLVMVAVGDPIGTGIVPSLAHPGGNTTGLSSIAPDLEGKRMELLREIVPQLSDIAVLLNPSNAFHVASMRQAQAAAKALQIKLTSVPVRTREELDNGFDTIIRGGVRALLVLADRVFLHNRVLLTQFATKNRLPGVYAYRELVEAGGLMSFGPNYADMHRRAATYVDKILKGAKPADLPVEQPTTFELLINLTAAKALGVTVPPSLLAVADEVIE
jgi:putative tryptophan/tyrosine transport system substrate-binding protein